jgi:hypothetical protein
VAFVIGCGNEYADDRYEYTRRIHFHQHHHPQQRTLKTAAAAATAVPTVFAAAATNLPPTRPLAGPTHVLRARLEQQRLFWGAVLFLPWASAAAAAAAGGGIPRKEQRGRGGAEARGGGGTAV